MPIVDKSTHLGIVRDRTVEKKLKQKLLNRILLKLGELFIVWWLQVFMVRTDTIQKRLYIYSGHLANSYQYGLELILPISKGLSKFDLFFKQLLKRILSLPKNTPDPAVYILSGSIPMEGQIDLKALTFFNNIYRQDDSSLEKQVSYRQLLNKKECSASWLVAIRKILLKYEFQVLLSC